MPREFKCIVGDQQGCMTCKHFGSYRNTEYYENCIDCTAHEEECPLENITSSCGSGCNWEAREKYEQI